MVNTSSIIFQPKRTEADVTQRTEKPFVGSAVYLSSYSRNAFEGEGDTWLFRWWPMQEVLCQDANGKWRISSGCFCWEVKVSWVLLGEHQKDVCFYILKLMVEFDLYHIICLKRTSKTKKTNKKHKDHLKHMLVVSIMDSRTLPETDTVAPTQEAVSKANSSSNPHFCCEQLVSGKVLSVEKPPDHRHRKWTIWIWRLEHVFPFEKERFQVLCLFTQG